MVLKPLIAPKQYAINMDSIIKFGQYVKHIRTKKGLTQIQLSLKVFDKPNLEYIGKLERGTLAGITFTTADKIMLALDSELEFREFESYQAQYPSIIKSFI